MKLNNFLKALLLCAVLAGSFLPVRADLATDAKLQYNKGIELYQMGSYEQAAECFKKATEYDPNYIDAYFNLGSLMEYLKQDDEALNAFKQIILRKPDDYEAVYKAAELSKKLGNIDKAKMYLTLIPTDSLIGSRAKELANSLEMDIPTAQAEQNKPESFSDANPMNNSNGVYNDISSPTGITTDAVGNLYVAGFSDNTIYKITPEQQKMVYVKSPKIDGPIGLERDSQGNLYIANYNKNNVLKVDIGGTVSEIITNIQSPYCMHITGDLLFVSAQGSNQVIRYKLNN